MTTTKKTSTGALSFTKGTVELRIYGGKQAKAQVDAWVHGNFAIHRPYGDERSWMKITFIPLGMGLPGKDFRTKALAAEYLTEVFRRSPGIATARTEKGISRYLNTLSDVRWEMDRAGRF
jgi:hypothetical protein